MTDGTEEPDDLMMRVVLDADGTEFGDSLEWRAWPGATGVVREHRVVRTSGDPECPGHP